MMAYYESLILPAWAPPAVLFGYVWTPLYIIIFITYSWVFFKVVVSKDIPYRVGIPFFLNILLNLSFTPVQFILQIEWLALLVVMLVVVTLVWALVAIKPYAPKIAVANIPYLLWGMFATVLQFTITWLNW